MKTLALLLALPLSNCAHTVFYHEGKKVAQFEGDMTDFNYTRHADGSATWSGRSVSHSAATRAQGEAAAGKINALATAGVATLFAP